jgi:hypothetical protein
MPFAFDEDALLKAVRDSDGFKQLQEEANERVRALVQEVNATHAGRPTAEVDAELRRRFEASGVTPEEPGFTKAVRAIARGKLSGG